MQYKDETKDEFLARQSHEQLEIFVKNTEMQNDMLKDRLFLLTGCRNFGGQDGTDGTCIDCYYNDRKMFERCRLFKTAAHTYLTSNRSKARDIEFELRWRRNAGHRS